MSTILMSQCWPLAGMSPAQKAVLISLADQANDDGYCWPSVGTISKRTCLSERAVQGAIKWLHSAGLLTSDERRGTSSVYRITPAAYVGATLAEWHYVYMVAHPATGRFYIGSRTSSRAPEIDEYMGSGAHLRDIPAAECVKTILSTHTSRDEANRAESAAIAASISNPLCVNKKVTNPSNAGGGYIPPQEMRPADAAPRGAGNAPPPPQMLHPTPADAAPKPSMNRQLNRKEPKDTRAVAQSFVLPDWIPVDTWAAFMETRKTKKAKSTDYALSLIVKSLADFKAAGHNPVDILNASIKAGWSDVYPPKVPASAMTPARRTPAPENFASRTYTGGKL